MSVMWNSIHTMDFCLSLPSPRWGGAPAAATGLGVANTGRRAPAEMPGGSGWGPRWGWTWVETYGK